MSPVRRQSAWLHILVLAATSVGGGLAIALPAIHSEIGNAYPAGVRVIIGAICGAIVAPMFVIVGWRKPLATSTASVFIPAVGAAVIARIAWSDDYSLTHIGVPLTFVTTLVTFFVVPDRVQAPNCCGSCGYDLRGAPGALCPECGSTLASRRGLKRWGPQTALHGGVLLLAMIACGIVQALFIRWILSLG